ncbi:THO complex subunit 3 [Escovopsis weberi]|uniref:THO complex subunit 3 n=1 Tax=Escovopsis weberi TaxID=150374 RepID=A0A0M8N0U0_ESCWE|nr:THO complex subunit 3 [Escovopsis weberi]
MAPILRPRVSLPKDKFAEYWGGLRSQPYTDPNASRAAGPFQYGTLIATGSVDKTLRVWNPEKPNVKFSTELKGHTAGIEKVAFNPTKDAELCSLSSDGVVRFWDVRTKACFNEVTGLGDAMTLVWAPDGQTLLVGNRADNIFVLSPTQPTPLASHQQPTQTNQIAFCWSGRRIFVTTSEGGVRILSYPGFEPVLHLEAGGERREFELRGHTSSCLTAGLQPLGRYLATGGADSVIALWDTTDWLCQRTITRMTGPVRSLSSGLEVTHVETGEHVHTFKTAGACPVVAWAPTRYCLAYGDLGVLRIVGVDLDRK